MPKSLFRLAVVASVLVCGIACSKEQRGNRKETSPVKGKVLVDGQPVGQMAVRCFSVTGIDKENPSLSSCFTGQDGTFQISTYEQGDGVPEGEYALTFQWGELNLFSKSYDGDKLNGRYNDPAKSEVKFTVTKGQPVELGEIKLTTK